MNYWLDYFLKYIVSNFIIGLIVGLILFLISRKFKQKKIKKTIKENQKNLDKTYLIASITTIIITFIIISIFSIQSFVNYKMNPNDIQNILNSFETINTSNTVDTVETKKPMESVIPNTVGTCDTPGEANSIFIDGDYVYIADGNNGLQIIDIKDKENPKIIGNFDTDGFLNDVFVKDDYAYLADTQSFTIIDINDKSNPKLITSYDLFKEGTTSYLKRLSEGDKLLINYPNVNSVFIDGEYAYLTDNIGLKIFNITDKSKPILVGSIDTFYNSKKVYVNNNFAYVIDDIDGLQIIDISDKKNPFKIGMCDTPGSAEDICIKDKYAYIADGLNGLFVVDLEFKDFFPIGTTITHDNIGNLNTVFKDNNYVYICNNNNFTILEIHMNENIFLSDYTIINNFATNGKTNDLFIKENYAYLANTSKGLEIIKLK